MEVRVAVVAVAAAAAVKSFARSALGGVDFADPADAVVGVVDEAGQWDDIGQEEFAVLAELS